MKSSPIRRLFAWFGLIAMAPIGYMVFNGSMTAADGGTKAAIVLIAVAVAIRFVEFALVGVAAVLERTPPTMMPPPDGR